MGLNGLSLLLGSIQMNAEHWIFGSLSMSLIQTIIFVAHLRGLKQERLTLTKILASRTMTEYALAEKTLDPQRKPEQKEPSYDQAWDQGEGHG